MVMIAPSSASALAAAPPPETGLASQLEDALADANPEQLARSLIALKLLSDVARSGVLDQLDPAALQVLLEALGQLLQGGPPGAAPRPGGFSPRPSLPGTTQPGAPARHAPVTPRTNGLGATDPAPAMKSGGKTPAKLREKHAGPAGSAQLRLSSTQAQDAAAFRRNFEQNRGRYEAVAQKTDLPAELIAALHWRESGGDFGTYLHQGDPLGRPAVHVPRNIPVFDRWEDSAVHALGQKAGYQQALGLNQHSTDPGALAAYAELYNGLGYHFRNRPSPYVYAGTDRYGSGKYVADGVFDASAVDKQVGVMALLQALR